MRSLVRRGRALMVAGLAAALLGCASDGTSPRLAHWRPRIRPDERMPWDTRTVRGTADANRLPERPSGRLRPGDRVVISLFKPQPEEIKEIVDQGGYVTLPLIKQVKVAGLSTSEAEDLIERAYVEGGYYQKLDVALVAQEYQYFIGGEVKAPGRYPLSPGMTLLRAITSAGGYTEYANPSKITVRRGDKVLRYNANRIGKDADDPPIESEDVVEVKRTLWPL